MNTFRSTPFATNVRIATGSMGQGLCTVLLIFWVSFKGFTQDPLLIFQQDSILTINLDEVIVISSKSALEYHKKSKSLSSIDAYLESAQKVQMIKRGAYAWEPTLNNMASERLSITIDGMRIFGACTDKMDPITSYVDVSNLAEAHVASGQQGAKYGTTIGGAIDLEIDKSNFSETGFSARLENGFESNNQQRIIGANANYSNASFFVDNDIMFRKAANYIAGGGEEVAFSQFEKYNIATHIGYKFQEGKALYGTIIFDEARDIGYPALTMDVSLARAFITSLSFDQETLGPLKNWSSKIYFNKVTHIMDDSKRPDVPIRMDMPGWSTTFGFLSEAAAKVGLHHFLVKWDGFYNQSLAEMTMYPQNPNEKEMFMLTWPDVHSVNVGLYGEDTLKLPLGTLKVYARMALQNARIADEMGFNSLRIFNPNMTDTQHRFLKSVAVQWNRDLYPIRIQTGISYGDRAPSVSEAFGFYLFNSFDNHDYIGNPNLKNEQSIEGNLKITLEKSNVKASLDGSIFRMPNYIIGEVHSGLSAMTIGAQGVKMYKNLNDAQLATMSFNTEYKPSAAWSLKALVSYHRGKDDENRNLPFISPLTYTLDVHYRTQDFSAGATMNGAGKQVHFNPDFGEDQTLAYRVFSVYLGKDFKLNHGLVFTKLGAENILDTYYSTYTDWKNIPRMGRNFFVTLAYHFQ
ncbi:TonB-dependent receptor [Arenibacter sp. GZD96]|uniref:hypothetical protein n=1 Tax=Aurantibrevibacter litoralis TaxID=3106030 RepID=UPI002AFE2C7F|nr:hypothetical protein [Arenibacter sp. GZD-96]MEA1785231.1 TonB-dependent receptor [Arenibacter sp. GZD-96]